MRHWDEWQKDHKFKTDKLDDELCILFTELQLFTQKMYFGQFTKDHLKDSDELVTEQSYDSEMERLLEYYKKMPDEFMAKDIPNKFNISASYARVIISQLVNKGLIEAGKGKPKNYVKLKKQ